MKQLFFSLILSASLCGNQIQETTEKPKLSEFKFNVNSQFGEDGIIEAIFNIIGTQSKLAVEFGAWDGMYLSNTANLFSNYGWEAILIECDHNKFQDLVNNVKKYKCSCFCETVGIGSHSLESILQKNNINYSELDLLSIDIDSNDYYIFESLEKMRPRVIICEYNPTIPVHLDIYAPYNNGDKPGFGCSVGALMRLAKQKNYTLIALTECNAFFVRNDEIEKFQGFELELHKIKLDRCIRYVITDFQGRYAIIASEDFCDPFGIKEPLHDSFFGNVKINP